MNDLFPPATEIPPLITSAAMAHLLGFTTRRLAQLVKEGMPKYQRDRFEPAAAIQWYIKHCQNVGQDALTTEEQRRELLREQTIKTRLENDESRQILLRADVVAGVLYKMAAILSSELDAMPARMAIPLAQIDNPAEIQATLRPVIWQIRNGFAEGIQKHVGPVIDEANAIAQEAQADD